MERRTPLVEPSATVEGATSEINISRTGRSQSQPISTPEDESQDTDTDMSDSPAPPQPPTGGSSHEDDVHSRPTTRLSTTSKKYSAKLSESKEDDGSPRPKKRPVNWAQSGQYGG